MGLPSKKELAPGLSKRVPRPSRRQPKGRSKRASTQKVPGGTKSYQEVPGLPSRPARQKRQRLSRMRQDLSEVLGVSLQNRTGPRTSHQTWGTLRERQYAGGARRGQDLPGDSRASQQAWRTGAPKTRQELSEGCGVSQQNRTGAGAFRKAPGPFRRHKGCPASARDAPRGASTQEVPGGT